MITDGIQLYNVRALEQLDGMDRVLCRIPPEIQPLVHPWTLRHFRCPANSELRFRTSAFPVMLHLTVGPEPVYMAVFLGDQLIRRETLPAGAHRIRIEPEPLVSHRTEFAPDLVRVMLLAVDGMVSFDGISSAGTLSPPLPRDVPKLRYLAYGSSITHGHRATSPERSYTYLAARQMHADLINMGVGGSAYLEPGLGQYLAEALDFDLFTAEISVNMLNQGYSADEFYTRAKEFLTRIHRAHPDALKAVISILPCFWDLGKSRPDAVSTAQIYREVTRSRCDDLEGAYLFLDGRELLHMENLSPDQIHPNDAGMEELGHNIAGRLMAARPELFR